MAYEIDCRLCGEAVRVSRRRYVALIDSGESPVCRKNGCYRYEQRGAAGKPGAARKSQQAVPTHVAGKVFVAGRGRRGHQHAPLANGRVRLIATKSYGDGLEVDE